MTGTWKFKVTKGREHAGTFLSTPDTVTASCAWPEHPAVDAFGGRNQFWSANTDKFPQWWKVDLGKSQQVQGVRLTFEDKGDTFQGRIETSEDAKTWNLLTDLKSNPPADNGEIAMTPTTCRYFRVTLTDGRNPQGKNRWAFIRHIEIRVLHDGSEVAWNPDTDSDAGKLADFASPDFDDRGFSTITVPANWEMPGFSIPTYDNPDNAVGLYRRTVEVPVDFAGKRVLWHFDGVFETAEVFINGRRAGYHESGFTAFDLDVTDFIRPGQENLFAVRVCKNADSVDLDTGDYWALGGIYRDNYLVALPPTHVDDTTIITNLDSSYKNATLNAAVSVAGQPQQSFEVMGQLYQFDGTLVPTPGMSASGRLDAQGKATVRLSQPVAAPKLWSAEKPDLYYLVTTLTSEGKRLEQTQQRFGFKQIEIKDGVLLWNGVPIKCTGTCRHEEWSALGHALTEHEWETDVTLMKAANINAIRTSHYIDAERFLELCDEKGFYVLDEIPFCWADPTNTSYTPAYLQRTDEAYARDKNRPCILAWSMGNESGFGPVNNAGFEEIQKLDPTRPAFISGALSKDNPKLSLLDWHYPSSETLQKLVSSPERKTRPMLVTEGPHIFYISDALDYDYGVKDFWVYPLINQWNFIWPNDSMLGAFIWEWQDQGLADAFPGRTGVDAQGLRSNNNKGFVDGYRNIKPEYFNVKMVYSPVVIDARNFEVAGNSIPVRIQNRYSFTDLSELTCHWEAFMGDKQIASGDQHIPCASRSSCTANFNFVPGMDTLRLEFIHPDGRSIYVTRLEVKGTPHSAPPAEPAAKGTVSLRDNGVQIVAAVGDTELIVDKSSGAIISWMTGGEKLLAGNLVLNLGEGRPKDKDSKDYIWSAQPPQLSNPAVTSNQEGDRVKIIISNDFSLVESPKWKGKLVETLTLCPDGQLDIGWEMVWDGEDARTWELGMKVPVPRALDHMEWRRDSQWTEYPPGHIGANSGTANPGDLAFRSTKRDLEWLTLSAPGQKAALCLVKDADVPLHARGKAEKDDVILYANEASVIVIAAKDFAHGLLLNQIVHLQHGHTYTGGFSLRPIVP